MISKWKALLPLLVLTSTLARAAEPNWDVLGAITSDDQEATPAELMDEFELGGVRLPEYKLSDLTALARGNASFRVEVEVFKRPVGLGVNHEFALLSVDGQVKGAYAVSTARNGKYTIEGSYPLAIPHAHGKPFPWTRSHKYQNSSMFWGLQISGGYFIHSTPHYGDLGRPASMGCVRVSFPTSMELWDLVVNEMRGAAVIRIYKSGSTQAQQAFAAKGVDAGWVNDRIESDLADAHAVTTGDYDGYGHARRGDSLHYPMCDDVDCFDYFHVKKP